MLQKIKKLLDYKIKLDLNTQLTWKNVILISMIFVVVMIIIVNIVSNKYLLVNKQGVFERKIEMLENESKQADDSGSAIELALTYYLDGDIKKAQEVYEDLLEQDKNNGLANIYYGLILTDQKKYSKAIPYLEKGIKLLPSQAKLAYLYLGMSYYYTGNLNKAVLYLEISTKVDPGSPTNFYYLGLSYKKAGKYQQAETAFAEAIKLSGGKYPEAITELRRIPKNQNQPGGEIDGKVRTP